MMQIFNKNKRTYLFRNLFHTCGRYVGRTANDDTFFNSLLEILERRIFLDSEFAMLLNYKLETSFFFHSTYSPVHVRVASK